MNRSTHKDRDDGVSVLPGIDPPSSLGPPQAGSVIIQFRPRTAAMPWSDDASSLDLNPPPELGELAVRFVANWGLPSLRCFVQVPDGEEDTWDLR